MKDQSKMIIFKDEMKNDIAKAFETIADYVMIVHVGKGSARTSINVSFAI